MTDKQADAFAAIIGERDYQDRMQGNSRRDHVEDQRDLGSLIVFMDVYMGKVKAGWAMPHPEGRAEALNQIRKVAALAVLAMELNGAPKREG